MEPVPGDTFTTRLQDGRYLNTYVVVGQGHLGTLAVRAFTHDTMGRAHAVNGETPVSFAHVPAEWWHDESPLYLEGYGAWGACRPCPFTPGAAAVEWFKGYDAAQADGVAYAERNIA